MLLVVAIEGRWTRASWHSSANSIAPRALILRIDACNATQPSFALTARAFQRRHARRDREYFGASNACFFVETSIGCAMCGIVPLWYRMATPVVLAMYHHRRRSSCELTPSCWHLLVPSPRFARDVFAPCTAHQSCAPTRLCGSVRACSLASFGIAWTRRSPRLVVVAG